MNINKNEMITIIEQRLGRIEVIMNGTADELELAALEATKVAYLEKLAEIQEGPECYWVEIQ